MLEKKRIINVKLQMNQANSPPPKRQLILAEDHAVSSGMKVSKKKENYYK